MADELQFALSIIRLQQEQKQAAAQSAALQQQRAFENALAAKRDARDEERLSFEREQFKVRQEAIWKSEVADARTRGRAIIDKANPFFDEASRLDILQGPESDDGTGKKVRKGGTARIIDNPANPNQYIVLPFGDAKEDLEEADRVALARDKHATEIMMNNLRVEERRLALQAARAKANSIGRVTPEMRAFADDMATSAEKRADENLNKALQKGGPKAAQWITDKWSLPENSKIKEEWDAAHSIRTAALNQLAQGTRDPRLVATVVELEGAESIDEAEGIVNRFLPRPPPEPSGPRDTSSAVLHNPLSAPPLSESSLRFSPEAQEAARRARLRELLKKKRSGNWTPADKAEVEGIYRGQQQAEEADIERIRSQAR